MTLEQVLFAIAAGAVSSVVVTLVGAIASRRFGLPGLARQVTSEQGELIETLQTRLEIAEQDAKSANAKADETERRRDACEQEIRRVKRDLRDTEAELLDLYRRTGERPPKSLTARHQQHVDDES